MDTITNTIKETAARTERRIKGAKHQIDRLQKTVDKVSGKMFMLIYDIPTEMNETCPNPSHLLWHYGFRLNLSCWVLPEKSLEAVPVKALLQHWANNNIETHIIEYAAEAVGQIREIARRKLTEEIIRVHTSLLERIQGASERYDAVVKELTGEKAINRATQVKEAQVRSILKQSQEALDAAINCAQNFDETESTEMLINGLRQAVISQKEAFNAEMALKGAKLAK